MTRFSRLAIGALTLVAALTCSEKPRGLEAFSGPELRRVQLDEGLVVRVLSEGTGATIGDRDMVRLHYVLRLEDGSVLESSHDGRPLAILVGHDPQYIDGLHQGLVGARAGELREIVVPPALGYRGRAMGRIPPRAHLFFAVEIVDVAGVNQ